MEYKFRVIVVGDFGCGKTSLLRSITDNIFNFSYVSTIGVDYFDKKFSHNSLFCNNPGSSKAIHKTNHKDKMLGIKNIEDIKKGYCSNPVSDCKLLYKTYNNALEESKDNNMDLTYHLRMWDTSGQERFSKLINAYYKNISAAIIMFDLTSYDSFISVTRWHTEILNKLEIADSTHLPIILVGNKSDLGSSRAVMLGDCIGLSNKLGCTYVETSVKNGNNTLNIVKYIIKNIIENITQKKVIPDSKNGIYISYKGENILFKEEISTDSKKRNKSSKFNCCVIN